MWIENIYQYIIYSLKPIKIGGPKKMLQRLPKALAEVSTCNTSGKLVNKIRQISNKWNYEKSVEQYNKFNTVITRNEYFIYEFWKHWNIWTS